MFFRYISLTKLHLEGSISGKPPKRLSELRPEVIPT